MARWCGFAHDRRAGGCGRKTARRYVEAAQAAGLCRDAGRSALCDELIGAVIAVVRPARPNGHGAAWDLLAARKEEITKWVKDGLSVVKIEVLLTRSGTRVPYRTLHRFASEECGFRARGTSMRVLDGDPGVECVCGIPHRNSYEEPGIMRRGRSGLVRQARFAQSDAA